MYLGNQPENASFSASLCFSLSTLSPPSVSFSLSRLRLRLKLNLNLERLPALFFFCHFSATSAHPHPPQTPPQLLYLLLLLPLLPPHTPSCDLCGSVTHPSSSVVLQFQPRQHNNNPITWYNLVTQSSCRFPPSSNFIVVIRSNFN